MGRMAQEEWGA